MLGVDYQLDVCHVEQLGDKSNSRTEHFGFCRQREELQLDL